MVTIYHGGSWADDPVDEIKPGDWVSLYRSYAKQHAEARGSNKVISREVPAEHVSWAGTDEYEWFYTPPMAESFRTWLEQEEKYYAFEIASAYSYTSGVRAFRMGDTESPARDCHDSLDWDLWYTELPPEIEGSLVQAKAQVVSEFTGFRSYHECMARYNIDVYFEDEELGERLRELKGDNEVGVGFTMPTTQRTSGYTSGPKRVIFPFQGYRDAIIKTLDMFDFGSNPPKEFEEEKPTGNPGSRPGPKPGESSEEHLARRMRDAEQAEFQRRPLEGD